MPADSLKDLYVHKLQDLYSAEEQIARALVKMADKATNPELRRGFEAHMRQTEQQRDQLEQLLESLGQKAGKENCRAMEGIIDENQKVMKMISDDDTLDAALVAGAQAVEHYEIAGYGTAKTWARELGREYDAQVLEQILEQEKTQDELLTQLAEARVNRQALHGDREIAQGTARDVASGGTTTHLGAHGDRSGVDRPGSSL
jgi:ferritin-like metal-binding protein YciE